MASTTVVRPVTEPTPNPYYNTRGRVIGEVGSKWDLELTNYQTDFTAKTMALRHIVRPSSNHRQNNPHPKHVALLRRLTNEPVCTVKTMNHVDTSVSKSCWMQSLMKAQFKLPPTTPDRTTRFGCNKNKHLAASGIVPTYAIGTEKKEEPLLPACAENTTMMTTSNPFQYVPRRRKIIPKVLDESIGILQPPLPDKIPLGKPRHWKTSKRLVESAPTATLQVSNFDGGAPPDYSKTITGRKRCWCPAVKGEVLQIPGYMRYF